MPHRRGAGFPTFAGLFLIALATLMYEILLTRIFSVTMCYHFAFMAISMAMFGMTVGSLLVYLRRASFIPERRAGSWRSPLSGSRWPSSPQFAGATSVPVAPSGPRRDLPVLLTYVVSRFPSSSAASASAWR